MNSSAVWPRTLKRFIGSPDFAAGPGVFAPALERSEPLGRARDKPGPGVGYGKASPDVPVIGTYQDLPQFLAKGWIDQVISLCLMRTTSFFREIIAAIGDAMVDVKIVPDIHRFIQLGSQVEEFDGLPVVSLASTPLSGLNRVFKRVFDSAVSFVLLAVLSPLMLIIALLVKLTSKGPVLFSQERVGLDGKKV